MRRDVLLFGRVYGVYPCTGGFAFAILEVRGRLLDSGKIDLGSDNDEEFGTRLRQELSRWSPCALVMEDGEKGKRELKSRRRIALALGLARQLTMYCSVIDMPTLRVRVGLARDATRHEVAASLCRIFPEVAHRLPKPSVWKRDPRIHVFMALALAWSLASHSKSLSIPGRDG